MLQVKQFTFSNFGVNTYLLIDTATTEAAVVDPAMQTQRERDEFDHYIEANGVKLTQIINTHMHLDHCFGANYVKSKYGVKLAANVNDALLGQQFAQQCARFGMPALGGAVEIDVPLHDGDTITIGESSLQVIATPAIPKVAYASTTRPTVCSSLVTLSSKAQWVAPICQEAITSS